MISGDWLKTAPFILLFAVAIIWRFQLVLHSHVIVSQSLIKQREYNDFR